MTDLPEEPTRVTIGEPWDDEEAEYKLICDVLLPTALDAFRGTYADWDALDTKAMGVLALDAAALAVLIAVHQSINHYWWIAALVCAAGGGLIGAALWSRQIAIGPDVLGYHSDLREGNSPLDGARGILEEIVQSDEDNRAALDEKGDFYSNGLLVFVVGLILCVPFALLRPGGYAPTNDHPAKQVHQGQTGHHGH